MLEAIEESHRDWKTKWKAMGLHGAETEKPAQKLDKVECLCFVSIESWTSLL